MQKVNTDPLSLVMIMGLSFLFWTSSAGAQEQEEAVPPQETMGSEVGAPGQEQEIEEEPSLQEMEPSHGTHNLRSGFSRSPREFEARAGGTVSGLELTGLVDCEGFFEEMADIRLNYRAGEEASLRIYVDDPTDQDTSLAIFTPDNIWICNDDFGLTLQPVIDFQSPHSGDYEIFVGHYFEDMLTEVVLYVTEDTETDRPEIPLSGLNDDSGER